MKISGDDSYPPFEFINEDGEPDGFNIDLVKAICDRAGQNYEIRLDDWNVVRSNLEEGKVDLLAGMYYTNERDRYVDFSTPYIALPQAFIVRRGDDIPRLEAPGGEEILLQRDDIMHDFMLKQEGDFALVPVTNPIDALELLMANRYDAALLNTLQTQYDILNFRMNDLTIGPTIVHLDYCFAVREGDDEMVSLLNSGLIALKADGEYDRIYAKWFGNGGLEISWRTTRHYLLIVSIPLLLVILLILSWNRALKKNVSKATENLSGIINSMPSQLIGVNHEGKVIFLNRKVLDETGGTGEDAIGNDILSVHPIPPDIWKTMKDKLKQGQVYRDSVRTDGTNGGGRCLEYTLFPLDKERNGVIRIDDVTREKELEDQLNQSRKLEAVGLLAGGVAHDFNNMLTGIVGAADLLAENISEEERPVLDMIFNSAHSAADLTAQLLAFSRKKNFLPTRPVDIQDLLRKTRTLLQRTVNKKIEIIEAFEARKRIISGDVSQLENAFLNIAINAAHAMGDGGRLTMRTENPDGETIKITIEDTGQGIPPEILEKVFEPFFTTREHGRGTGLGMASAYGTVKGHKGDITIASDPGEGTAVTVILPLAGSQSGT